MRMSVQVCGVLVLSVLGLNAAEVRLAAFNVNHCLSSNGVADVACACQNGIASADFDFAAVQDVDWDTVRSGRTDQPAEIGRLSGMISTFGMAYEFEDGQFGATILSREKPIAKDEIRLMVPGKRPRLLLVLEFADNFFATAWTTGLGEKEGRVLREEVERKIAAYARRKPVFLAFDDVLTVDAAHRDFLCVESASGRATVRVPDPDLSKPVLVPAPVKYDAGAGFRTFAEREVTLALVSRETIDETLPNEGYRLEVSAETVSLASRDAAGAFYALQTLRQLAVPHWGRLYVPCCKVNDFPRFNWRGIHIDESRHFFGKAAVKRLIDVMSFHKFNTLHWHLTDSQGWRIPIPGYPKLVREGATRPMSDNHKYLMDSFDEGEYGPYAYTAEQIAEVVRYAADRHVRIVPEIDIPAHCRAVIRAYPEFSCFPDGKGRPADGNDDELCLGNEKTIRFLECAFDELCALFPNREIHVGGDEVIAANWRECPKCQARMKTLGMEKPRELLQWSVAEVTKHLAQKGRRAVTWTDRAKKGMIPQETIVMSWHEGEDGLTAARAGYDSVMCPWSHCYFDFDQGVRNDPAVYPWFSTRITLEKVYKWNPLAGVPPELHDRILGGQCCSWAEFICNERELQWVLWPRACALAEVLWSPEGVREYADFRRRMETHRGRLLADGVFCAPFSDAEGRTKSNQKKEVAQ